MNPGIDYGFGKTNRDPETDIRYGVIHPNNLDGWSWDEILTHAENIDFSEFKQQVINNLATTISNVIEEAGGRTSVEEQWRSAEAIFDDCDFDYSNVDSGRYLYECDGYKIQTSDSDDGDWFILKSRYYTNAQFCSPCAPGAGYLMSPCESGPKTYCLGLLWFPHGKCPYPVYLVSDGSCIYKPMEETDE